jgi:hypothetical protein
MHYILLEDKHLEGLSDKRVKCLINENIEIHSALMKKKKAGFISILEVLFSTNLN